MYEVTADKTRQFLVLLIRVRPRRSSFRVTSPDTAPNRASAPAHAVEIVATARRNCAETTADTPQTLRQENPWRGNKLRPRSKLDNTGPVAPSYIHPACAIRHLFGTGSEDLYDWTHTAIEWTNAAWNPMTGCTKISAGCDYCYAALLAQTKTRDVYLRRRPVKESAANLADPFAPRFWEDRLRQPLSWRTPKRIFVNSMSDVFHAHFSVEMIRAVFDVMAQADWHQFQLLTKRPDRAARLSPKLPWPKNVWIGTSVESMNVHTASMLCGVSVKRPSDSYPQSPCSVRSTSWT